MKRMYVVLGIIFLLSLWMLQALGQKISEAQSPSVSQDEQFKRRMQLREEMHKRMRDKILHGIGSDDDLFQGMDQMMSDAFSDPMMMPEIAAGPKSEWSESTSGRTLTIMPEEPSQKIDLDVKENMITIKGESKSQDQNVQSVSSFSKSFPVPSDCDGGKVKISNKNGNIVMDFPFKNKTRPVPVQKDTRTPIPPMEDDVTI